MKKWLYLLSFRIRPSRLRYQSANGGPRPRGLNIFGLGAMLVALALGIVVWSVGQTANPANTKANAQGANQSPEDPAVERELSRLAILFPSEFIEKFWEPKTAEQLAEEAWIHLSILNPPAYEAELRKFQTAEQIALEQAQRKDAAWAVTDPAGYRKAKGIVKSEAEKLAEQRDLEAIAQGQPVRQ